MRCRQRGLPGLDVAGGNILKPSLPQRGSAWFLSAWSYPSSVVGFSSLCARYQGLAHSPTVTLGLVGSIHSPRSFDTSTVARYSSADRFVVNPRLSVWLRSGFL